MSALDETFTLEKYIDELKSRNPLNRQGYYNPVGETSANPGLTAGQRALWLNEVADIIQSVVPTGSFLDAQAKTLRNKELGNAEQEAALRSEVTDWLDATLRYSRLKKRDAITDDFRRAVEIAVKDGYFQNWPFRALLWAFAALTAVLYGGTIFSTWQVQGIQQRAEQAQESIREKSNAFQTKLDAAIEQIERKRTGLDTFIKDAVSANNSQIDEVVRKAKADAEAYIVATKASLKQTETKVVSTMNDELQTQLREAATKSKNELESKAKNISDEWKVVDQTLGKQLEEAGKQLDTAKDKAIVTLNSRSTEADDQKKIALSAIDAAKAVATNNISKFQAEIEGKRDESVRTFGKQNEDFSKAMTEAQKRMAIEIEKLPEDFKRVALILKSIDDALNKSKLSVAGVANSLASNQSNSSLALVVSVLGMSFWLMIGSLAISIVSCGLAIFCVLRRARRGNQRPADVPMAGVN